MNLIKNFISTLKKRNTIDSTCNEVAKDTKFKILSNLNKDHDYASPDDNIAQNKVTENKLSSTNHLKPKNVIIDEFIDEKNDLKQNYFNISDVAHKIEVRLKPMNFNINENIDNLSELIPNPDTDGINSEKSAFHTGEHAKIDNAHVKRYVKNVVHVNDFMPNKTSDALNKIDTKRNISDLQRINKDNTITNNTDIDQPINYIVDKNLLTDIQELEIAELPLEETKFDISISVEHNIENDNSKSEKPTCDSKTNLNITNEKEINIFSDNINFEKNTNNVFTLKNVMINKTETISTELKEFDNVLNKLNVTQECQTPYSLIDIEEYLDEIYILKNSVTNKNNVTFHEDTEKEIKIEDIETITISSDEDLSQDSMNVDCFGNLDTIAIASTEDDSDGYNSSDFEFISENEAKLAGIIQKKPKITNTFSNKANNCTKNANIPKLNNKSPPANHVLPDGDSYFDLFRGVYDPVLPHSTIFVLENKSTRPMKMNVDYKGMGYDMCLMKNYSDSTEITFKEDASETRKMILNMYPYENTKRRRRH